MRRRLVAAVLVSLVAAPSARVSAARSREILTASVYIEAAYDAVWERFTQAEKYEAWYSSPCREFGARPGDPVVWGNEERIFYKPWDKDTNFEEECSRALGNLLREGPTLPGWVVAGAADERTVQMALDNMFVFDIVKSVTGFEKLNRRCGLHVREKETM